MIVFNFKPEMSVPGGYLTTELITCFPLGEDDCNLRLFGIKKIE